MSASLPHQITTQKWQLLDEDEVKKIKLDVEREDGANIKQKLKTFLKWYHVPQEQQWNYLKKRVRRVGST